MSPGQSRRGASALLAGEMGHPPARRASWSAPTMPENRPKLCGGACATSELTNRKFRVVHLASQIANFDVIHLFAGGKPVGGEIVGETTCRPIVLDYAVAM